MQRYGMLIEVAAGKLEEYQRLHAKVWPSVLAQIDACHLDAALGRIEKAGYQAYERGFAGPCVSN